MADVEDIEIVGADANNLRNIDVRLPLRGVTMFMGVSGSGKSSLLEETLAAEAERRLGVFLPVPVETPHTPVRAFIGRLPPPIHVRQTAFRASARTTVGTATGLLSALRRLFLAHGRPWCDDAKEYVPTPNAQSYAAWLARHYRGPAEIWAIPVWYARTDGRSAVQRLANEGMTEILVTSPTTKRGKHADRPVPITRFRPLDPSVEHVIEARVGSIKLDGKTNGRALEQLLSRAFRAGGGRISVSLPEAAAPELSSPTGPRLHSDQHWVHPQSPLVYAPPSRHLLSFNAPDQPGSGACRTCHGRGRAVTLDEKRLVPHPERSMHSGAFALFTEKNYRYVNIQHETIEGLRGRCGFDPDRPWRRLPEAARRLIMDGSPDPVVDIDRKTKKKWSSPHAFEGFRQAILSRLTGRAGAALAEFVSEGLCPTCQGTRWSDQARALRVGSCGVAELLALTLDELRRECAREGPFFLSVPLDARSQVAFIERLADSFSRVGLGYVSGDRGMLDISQGESRRAQLAGVLYQRGQGLLVLLDEPARGLHELDIDPLGSALRDLGARHTVVINDHRSRLTRWVDEIRILGPGGGPSGGTVVYAGPPRSAPDSVSEPRSRPTLDVTPRTPRLKIDGATIHTMQDASVEVPIGRLVCLTGVSGSGKSNFARGVLVPAVARALETTIAPEDFATRAGTWSRLHGMTAVRGLVALDHRAPPPNRRSVLATFLGVAEQLRRTWASSREAKEAGLNASDFGFNSGSGRCATCLGTGEEEQAGSLTLCSACGGSRLGTLASSVRVEGTTLPAYLSTPIASLLTAPGPLSDYAKLLDTIDALGVGHLALGRAVDTLSGGEVQRLRIAMRLAEDVDGGLLFVMDEPAAGLHREDVARLLAALDRIVHGGRNTVVLVEHNLDILQAADWLIEFGPGAGPHGGRIVASGTPAKIAKTRTKTGEAMRSLEARATRPTRSSERLALGSGDAVTCSPARALAAFRRLRGDDIALPSELDDELDDAVPRIELEGSIARDRRPLEIGSLEHELALLALAEHQARIDDERTALLERWPVGGHLEVVPQLAALQVWGLPLPASSRTEAIARAHARGLEVTEERGGALLRAARRSWREVPAAQRAKALDEALLVGEGYVELRAGARLLAAVAGRPVDLDLGIVGPRYLQPRHMSRYSTVGACPFCRGSGEVEVASERLLIARPSAPVESESLLTKEALDAIRGMRRSDLVPLLKKLAADRLWPVSTSFARLSETQRQWFLYGLWARPGHGTYLRTGADAPEEVGAWLRWDGLHRHIFGELPRMATKHARWVDEVRATARRIACPSCSGIGMRSYARRIPVLGRTLHEWIEDGDTRSLHDAIRSARPAAERDRLRSKRLLRALSPVRSQAHPLRDVLAPDVAAAVMKRAIEESTTLSWVTS